MSENPIKIKKPILEPMNEKEIEEGRESYKIDIEKANAFLKEIKKQSDSARKDVSPNMQAHFASLYIQQYHYVETLQTFLNIAESIVEVYQNTCMAMQSLEKQIDEIAGKTGTDLTDLKTEVGELKQVMLPAAKGMINLIDNLDEYKAQRAKNGDKMIA